MRDSYNENPQKSVQVNNPKKSHWLDQWDETRWVNNKIENVFFVMSLYRICTSCPWFNSLIFQIQMASPICVAWFPYISCGVTFATKLIGLVLCNRKIGIGICSWMIPYITYLTAYICLDNADSSLKIYLLFIVWK